MFKPGYASPTQADSGGSNSDHKKLTRFLLAQACINCPCGGKSGDVECTLIKEYCKKFRSGIEEGRKHFEQHRAGANCPTCCSFRKIQFAHGARCNKEGCTQMICVERQQARQRALRIKKLPVSSTSVAGKHRTATKFFDRRRFSATLAAVRDCDGRVDEKTAASGNTGMTGKAVLAHHDDGSIDQNTIVILT